MTDDIFQLTERPSEELFFSRHDHNDARLGEIVSRREKDYQASKVVILGCPQEEGILRSGGRAGAALAPDLIRSEFYRLTNFGISAKILDLGNTIILDTLEETHRAQAQIISRLLADGKRVIVLGGGSDISYPGGVAMAAVYGPENWIAINIDAHLDVRADKPINSETPYRQLLEEGLIEPEYFYEVGYQPQYVSPVYFRYLQDRGVNLVSLDQLLSKESADAEVRELIKQKFVHHSATLNIFFAFDLDAVRAADAPGVSAGSPVGLRASDFLTLVKFAANLVNTRVVEFTDVNPNFDVDNRTSKLVAMAMHSFLAGLRF
jgi:formiminoglutamase